MSSPLICLRDNRISFEFSFFSIKKKVSIEKWRLFGETSTCLNWSAPWHQLSARISRLAGICKRNRGDEAKAKLPINLTFDSDANFNESIDELEKALSQIRVTSYSFGPY